MKIIDITKWDVREGIILSIERYCGMTKETIIDQAKMGKKEGNR